MRQIWEHDLLSQPCTIHTMVKCLLACCMLLLLLGGYNWGMPTPLQVLPQLRTLGS